MRDACNRIKLVACLAAAAAFLDASPAPAGTETESAPDKKMVVPPSKSVQTGMATLGVEASEDLTSGFLDGILPLWNPGDLYFFLNTRTNYNSDDQLMSSYGLGTRYLVPDHEVILGVNAFYDSIGSTSGNDFNQLGLGAEVLTHWVDARFNYYRPEDSTFEVSRHSEHDTDRDLGPVFTNKIGPRVYLLQQQRSTHGHRSTTRTLEAGLEGWNAEVGFLVPGLDKYLELRAFVGAYSYDSPVGKDFTGVKARIEARPLPGIIANVEYWDDAYLTGGHWTGELAVSVPFSIFNLASGRNPFEGFTDSFRPRQRQFNERLNDMIIRSHRVMTETGSQTTNTNTSTQTTATEGVIVVKPVVKPLPMGPPPPPQVGQGEG